MRNHRHFLPTVLTMSGWLQFLGLSIVLFLLCPSTGTVFDRLAQLPSEHLLAEFGLWINTCHVQTKFYGYWFLESSFYVPWHCLNQQKGLDRSSLASPHISALHNVLFIMFLLKQIFVFLIKDIFFSQKKIILFYFLAFVEKNFLGVPRSTFSWGINSNHGLCCQGTFLPPPLFFLLSFPSFLLSFTSFFLLVSFCNAVCSGTHSNPPALIT